MHMQSNVELMRALHEAEGQRTAAMDGLDAVLADLEVVRFALENEIPTIHHIHAIKKLKRLMAERSNDPAYAELRRLRRQVDELRERNRWLTTELDHAIYRHGVPDYLRRAHGVVMAADRAFRHYRDGPDLDPLTFEADLDAMMREMGDRLTTMKVALIKDENRAARDGRPVRAGPHREAQARRTARS